ncbi:MAG: methyltransferase domain-containing protein [Cyanobacteria bacterium P01_G01_bin.38]
MSTAVGTIDIERTLASGQCPNHLLLVDTHVHIYDCFNLDTFLESAWHNFHRHVSGYDSSPDFTGVLLLTETHNESWFTSLLHPTQDQGGDGALPTRWSFQRTSETGTVCAANSKGQRLYLIAGRQVITAEKLEVLALISDQTFPDGLSVEATIKSIQAGGGIAVLPWGVGKWLGKRGQLISSLLQKDQLSPLFLGDNRGRPQFWLRPRYFETAQQQGGRILPGTDPLPLASEGSRPGSFGWVCPGQLDPEKPGEHLRSMLLDPEVSWQTYGTLETPWRFVRNQIALRVQPKRSVSTPAIQDGNQAVIDPHFPETADIETASDSYASRFAGKSGTWLLGVQQAATLKMLADYPQVSVLDVGGGHGQLTEALIEQGHRVTVLGSAEVCKARIQKYLDNQACAFEVGNVLEMPYPEAAFDVVISYRFLAHVTQWQAFLKELARVARQAVIVDYPTVHSVNAIAPYLFKLKKGIEGNTRPFTCYRERDILDFYQSIGWEQNQRYAQFFWPMVLHRALGAPGLSSALETISRFSGLSHLWGSPVIAKFEKRKNR